METHHGNFPWTASRVRGVDESAAAAVADFWYWLRALATPTAAKKIAETHLTLTRLDRIGKLLGNQGAPHRSL